jgi:hypothetical protein
LACTENTRHVVPTQLPFDMGFRPYTVCYCEHCRRRAADEWGGGIPAVMGWNDSAWRRFAERRNGWLAGCPGLITRAGRGR